MTIKGDVMTKLQAVKLFKMEILPFMDKCDKVAIRCAWNDWTDSLCKNGEITESQYNKWSNPFN